MGMRLLRKSGDIPKRSLWQRIKDIALMDVAVLARGGVSAGSLEQLEQMLLEADFGVPVTLRLVEEVERRATRGLVKTQRRVPARARRGHRRGAARRQQRSRVSTLAPTRADGDSRRRRERRGQDDVHRQARGERFAARGSA